MPKPKISINVRVSPQLHRGIKKLAEKNEESFQAVVDRALQELLEREKAAA